MGGAARRHGKRTAAFVALALCASPGRAEDLASENRLLKERLRLLEAKVDALINAQSGAAKGGAAKARTARIPAETPRTNVSNAAQAKSEAKSGGRLEAKSEAPPPVFVSFKNGLFVETEDKAYSFKVGGRIIMNGGGISQPLNGFDNQAGFRQVRLEIEGKVASVWFYKLQYDFAGAAQISGNNQVLGGIRDAYFGIQSPLLALPFAKDPAIIMVGSFFEPFSLEQVNASKFRDFIERPMAVDTFSPSRHLGLAVGAYGDNWSAKAGVFTTSFEDANLNPRASVPATWGVPRFYYPNPGGGYFAGPANWWQATGGGQYFDLTGRLTYAPIKDEHDLLHIGVSGRYHQPNDSTAADNDRVLALGNRVRSEANILGQGLLGTPDLSCGTVTGPIPTDIFSASSFAGKCTKSVETFGVEMAASHGPFGIQAEYFGSFYNRDQSAIDRASYFAAANAATGAINVTGSTIPFNPGGRSAYFDGYYVQGTWWLTGEERAAAYSTKDRAGASFGELKIKHPVSAGGYGAWGLAARYSAVDLNNGPYEGNTLHGLIALATAAGNPFLRSYLANAGIQGGRQQNVTIGLNWYPDPGFSLQANWTRVMNVVAPFNGVLNQSYYTGAHPNLFELRARVYW